MMMWKTDEVPKIYLTALCCWREARGTSDDAMRGVIHAIKNRATKPSWWGSGYIGVILKPLQFSSFNSNDPNAVKFPADDDRVFARILELTEKIVMNQDEDLTDGATHYHNADIAPAWDSNMIETARIGPFKFFREK